VGKFIIGVLIGGLAGAWLMALGGLPVPFTVLLIVLAPMTIAMALVWWLTDAGVQILGPEPDGSPEHQPTTSRA
jgi:hypothetical protein